MDVAAPPAAALATGRPVERPVPHTGRDDRDPGPGVPDPFDRGEWGFFNNELVTNLLVSINRTSLVFIILIGVPLGYAMGRWWRVQAYFTDLVTVGLAMPAYMWALWGSCGSVSGSGHPFSAQ